MATQSPASRANPMSESQSQGSEPMREDQIQNAVNFLSNPRVRGSPVAQRRSFLEQKGLTKDEIDEAFRRVPDPSPNITSSSSPNQIQGLEPPVVSSPVKSPNSGINLYNALIAIGLLASTGAGAAVICKKSLIPRLKSWIRKVAEEEENDSKKDEKESKLSLNKEVMEAIKMASSAADVASRATQELQIAKNEEKKTMEVMMDMIDSKVEEMKSIGKSIRMIQYSNEVFSKEVDKSWTGANKSNSNFSFTPIKQINGTNNSESQSVKNNIPSKSENTMAPHPESYMEIIEMIQKGERPPNIKDINDAPPDPNQPIPKPRMAPKPKPWEADMPHQQNHELNLNGPNKTPNFLYNNEILPPGTNNESEISTNEVLFEV
ncbi:hypothetical protein LUZ60_000680 [Juncus effusus]|nr:hypothetical protein LUZ60_000680 [Juncus effusus]